MNASDLTEYLRTLHLTPKEAARQLSVDIKTVNRWLAGEVAVPGPVVEALRAWKRLNDARIPWRADSLPINIKEDEEMAEQIRLTREHMKSLDQVIQQVRARGGPAAPWEVDLKNCEAVLANTMYVHFYPLPNGNFSPSSYRRTDRELDYQRDLSLIEDAIACIADAISAAGTNWAAER